MARAPSVSAMPAHYPMRPVPRSTPMRQAPHALTYAYAYNLLYAYN